jgi:hypothetical protein
MQLAEELDVKNYPCPAGGCLLTEASFAPKVKDVFDHCDELNLRDFRLLKVGRHLRVGPRTKLIIGRNEAENNLLEAAQQPEEALLRWIGGSSPFCIITGPIDSGILQTAARIVLRYTKAEPGLPTTIKVLQDGNESLFDIDNTFTDADLDRYRI